MAIFPFPRRALGPLNHFEDYLFAKKRNIEFIFKNMIALYPKKLNLYNTMYRNILLILEVFACVTCVLFVR